MRRNKFRKAVHIESRPGTKDIEWLVVESHRRYEHILRVQKRSEGVH